MVSPVPGYTLSLVGENLLAPLFASTRQRFKTVIQDGLPQLPRPDGQAALPDRCAFEQPQVILQQISILENRLSRFNLGELDLRALGEEVVQEMEDAGLLVQFAEPLT